MIHGWQSELMDRNVVEALSSSLLLSGSVSFSMCLTPSLSLYISIYLSIYLAMNLPI